ncbi:Hypothetical predicted protein [Podarcis lilfordi]|uniref:Uncharacterized protein n=1 Tax=Podarcis lilfordi TaxID=74358 RepID=A0AA35KDH3_9SAUR|nr:Hypothetical predicted protein [Podarcis lilfordi]
MNRFAKFWVLSHCITKGSIPSDLGASCTLLCTNKCLINADESSAILQLAVLCPMRSIHLKTVTKQPSCFQSILNVFWFSPRNVVSWSEWYFRWCSSSGHNSQYSYYKV